MESEKKYDVAISFAEEDRDAALSLSLAFDSVGLKTYYYPDTRAEYWGADLAENLKNIYFEEATYAIVLFSDAYFAEHKVYTKIELEAIQRRMEERSDIVYMLPVKVNKDVSLTRYPNLEKLSNLTWEHNAKEIAQWVKQLLGKELREPDDNVYPGNILYSSGEHPFVIANTNINNFSQNIITNSRESPVVTQEFISKFSLIQQINIHSPKDTRFPCVNCSYILDGKEFGQIACPNCKKLNYVDNPDIAPRKYNTRFDKNEEKEYGNLLTHIRNKIKDREYGKAYQFCLKAEEMAPGEYTTWELFALTEFLLEIYKDRNERKSSLDIIKKIKTHLEKAKDFKISDKEHEVLLLDIANRLFSIEKSRVLSLLGQYDDKKGFDQWSKGNFRHLLELLKSFEICYNLCKDPVFLKEYALILCQKGQWIIKRLDGELLTNLPTPVFFNATEKLQMIISRIREHDPEYKRPETSVERLIIKKAFQIKIVSVH